MSKFRFYITNLHGGIVEGTNDEQLALSCTTSEDFFVVDSKTGEWLEAGRRIKICKMADENQED